MTQPFCQACSPVIDHLIRSGTVYGGICEAVSAFWVRERLAGRSLWDGLIGAEGDLMRPLIDDVMDLQHRSMQAPIQHHLTEGWLAENGVHPDPGSTHGAERTHAPDLAQAVTTSSGQRGSPVLMLKIGGIHPHSVAADTSNARVLYFDANYGEFAFPTHEAFREWFPRYWAAARYGIGLAGRWTTHHYALTADAGGAAETPVTAEAPA